MKALVVIAGAERWFDLTAGKSIGLLLHPNGPQPRFFGSPPATQAPLEVGAFVGAVKQGASCNAAAITLVPHCNGTHTEGPGHITRDAEPVQTSLPGQPVPAWLVSVTPQDWRHADERYPLDLTPAEGLITSACLALADAPGCKALVIRTLPNYPDKRSRDYGKQPWYPVLSAEAMQAIVGHGIEHLLIDTPSVDRADDGGGLLNHRNFWDLPAGSDVAARRQCTITEMIFVPDEVADGLYLLDLRVAPIVGDASPSAPIIYPLL